MNHILRTFNRSLVVIALFFSGLALAGHHEKSEMEKNLVQVAANNDDFQTLVMAIKAADLVETLEGKGPFTVLAPTDDAFAKLPEGALAELLKPENKEKLQAILTYHVLPGALSSEEVMKLKLPETVQGGTVAIETDDDGKVTINGANVILADVPASNGVIHVIDTVLIPTEKAEE
ncbi:fasciclin domain-containing protein [Photobacterium sp. DNB23_23_1]|uniref:Fasciclin domain-containing protein n=1 Tax=Photobacterium pectinilyticum TaxID=2906793 RepID=A0ABT1N8J1_9GAMM|nr:fasciclin domain-containing protein [Photobacterium sp. ZSDE20]MCQ1060417.1 fasciclin domain-containing protein [Photobacterium sp. ZSDE20]MDD1827738.1 fasciclin domain-containing protein [Photobacterium sp. ZSDE20]